MTTETAMVFSALAVGVGLGPLIGGAIKYRDWQMVVAGALAIGCGVAFFIFAVVYR